MYYVCYDGEVEEVVVVLNEQYMLCFVGDELLSCGVLVVVVMVDKFDIIVGIFGIGQVLKGSDLFVLCCVLLGVLCILVEYGYQLDLVDLIVKVKLLFGDCLINVNVEQEVIEFMFGCFLIWY